MQLNPPEKGMACQVFVHKNVDGKQALVRSAGCAFHSSWAVEDIRKWRQKKHGKTEAVGLQQNILIV